MAQPKYSNTPPCHLGVTPVWTTVNTLQACKCWNIFVCEHHYVRLAQGLKPPRTKRTSAPLAISVRPRKGWSRREPVDPVGTGPGWTGSDGPAPTGRLAPDLASDACLHALAPFCVFGLLITHPFGPPLRTITVAPGPTHPPRHRAAGRSTVQRKALSSVFFFRIFFCFAPAQPMAGKAWSSDTCTPCGPAARPACAGEPPDPGEPAEHR